MEGAAGAAISPGEMHINATTVGNQNQSATASAPGGHSVVVWTDRPTPSDDTDIRARVYNTNKNPVAEISIAATGLFESEPAVAMDAFGRFVVVWTSRSSATATQRNVFGARFSSTGARLSSFKVAVTSSIEFDPSVARAGNGQFVVAYTRSPNANLTQKDVIAKMFNTNGALLKTFLVGATSVEEEQSSVARNGSGVFAIGYQTNSNDVHLRRYDAAGNLLGTHAVAATARRERSPSVAMTSSGNAVVVWQDLDPTGTNWNVRARRVSSSGVLSPIGTVAATSANETRPVAARDYSDGDYVVALQVGPTGSSARVRVTELSSAGVIRTTFDLGTARVAPAISIDGQDRYLVTYTRITSSASDPGHGIFGRIGIL